MSWRDKANREIADSCMAAYIQANRKADGKYRRKYVPYSVPDYAAALVKCLATDDEHEAKRLFHVARCGAWTQI